VVLGVVVARLQGGHVAGDVAAGDGDRVAHRVVAVLGDAAGGVGGPDQAASPIITADRDVALGVLRGDLLRRGIGDEQRATDRVCGGDLAAQRVVAARRDRPHGVGLAHGVAVAVVPCRHGRRRGRVVIERHRRQGRAHLPAELVVGIARRVAIRGCRRRQFAIVVVGGGGRDRGRRRRPIGLQRGNGRRARAGLVALRVVAPLACIATGGGVELYRWGDALWVGGGVVRVGHVDAAPIGRRDALTIGVVARDAAAPGEAVAARRPGGCCGEAARLAHDEGVALRRGGGELRAAICGYDGEQLRRGDDGVVFLKPCLGHYTRRGPVARHLQAPSLASRAVRRNCNRNRRSANARRA